MAIVTKLIPDESSLGDVNTYLKTRMYPSESDTSNGPYTSANPTDVRVLGRQVRVRHEANSASDWRVGTYRAEVSTGGRR